MLTAVSIQEIIYCVIMDCTFRDLTVHNQQTFEQYTGETHKENIRNTQKLLYDFKSQLFCLRFLILHLEEYYHAQIRARVQCIIFLFENYGSISKTQITYRRRFNVRNLVSETGIFNLCLCSLKNDFVVVSSRTN